jgi:hypothetical protein
VCQEAPQIVGVHLLFSGTGRPRYITKTAQERELPSFRQRQNLVVVRALRHLAATLRTFGVHKTILAHNVWDSIHAHAPGLAAVTVQSIDEVLGILEPAEGFEPPTL